MDRRMIEDLYRQFGPLVLRRARSMLRDEWAAHDAVQEVFVSAMRSGSQFRAAASPTTWLYRVTTNYCLNVLRNEARRAELWIQHGPVSDPSVDPLGETRIHLMQVLRRVRPELQEIAVYYLIDELNHNEIAELLGVSRRTIGNRLDEFRAEITGDEALCRGTS